MDRVRDVRRSTNVVDHLTQNTTTTSIVLTPGNVRNTVSIRSFAVTVSKRLLAESAED